MAAKADSLSSGPARKCLVTRYSSRAYTAPVHTESRDRDSSHAGSSRTFFRMQNECSWYQPRELALANAGKPDPAHVGMLAKRAGAQNQKSISI